MFFFFSFFFFFLLSSTIQRIYCKPVLFQQEEEYPKIIWAYHEGMNMSAVEFFVSMNTKRLKNEWRYIVLTPDTIHHYLDINTFPLNYNSFTVHWKADYLRVRLVEEYGGMWIDLSVLIGDVNYLNDMREKMIETKSELFGQYYHDGPKYWIEVGCFYAKKNSLLMKEWRKEIDKAFKMGAINYLYYMDQQAVILPKEVLKSYPVMDRYFLLNAAYCVALSLRIPRNPRLLLVPAGENMFALVHHCHWKADCVKEELYKEVKESHYNMTKLIGGGVRKRIWPDPPRKRIRVPKFQTTLSIQKKVPFSYATKTFCLRNINKIVNSSVLIILYFNYRKEIYNFHPFRRKEKGINTA